MRVVATIRLPEVVWSSQAEVYPVTALARMGISKTLRFTLITPAARAKKKLVFLNATQVCLGPFIAA
jgi:hypothetical protein